MVSFTNIPYSEAWIIGLKQEKIMQKIMQIPNLEKKWDQQEVMDAVLDLL